MEFRIAKYEDASQIGALHAASWRTTYRGMLSDEYLDGDLLSDRTELWVQRLRTPQSTQRVVLADVEGEVAGFACAFGSEDPDLGTLLDNLHISREFQRHGIGKKLMSEIASWCLAEYPGEGLHLWVLEANWPARNFYHQLGGTIVSEDVWLGVPYRHYAMHGNIQNLSDTLRLFGKSRQAEACRTIGSSRCEYDDENSKSS